MIGTTARYSALGALCLALVSSGWAQSPVKLEVAGQPSLASDRQLLLIYSDAVDAALASPASFSLTPSRTISSAVVHPSASNVVVLNLSPATPLQAGISYHLKTVNGKDALGQPLAADLTSGTFTATNLRREIDNILACQIPDGAYSTNTIGDPQWRNGEPLRLVPYYGCISAIGLIHAWKDSRDPALLDSARAYLEWHASRIPSSNFITDFTGWFPTYQSTGTFDSTDSYGALFASALWAFFQETGDADFLAAMYPALEKSVAAIDATLQADNLTWATPSYFVKFTMDNAEVYQGYFAASQLAYYSGRTAQYNAWRTKARNVRTAIHDELYLDQFGRYSKGKANSGSIYTTWSDYYPDAMANEMALFQTHFPTDAEFTSGWSAEVAQFFPGNVPDQGISAYTVLVAARAGDSFHYDLAFARALQNHQRYRYAHESAKLIEAERVKQERSVTAPLVSVGAITVDGVLSEPQWQNAPRLRFHKAGVVNGFANHETYEFPENIVDREGRWTVSWLHSGSILFLGIDVEDRYITSADVAGDSDGLSQLFIRNAANNALLHQATYTFFPNNEHNTVPTAPPGTILSNPAAGNAAFSFKPGNNTPNDDSDLDTGYQMEIAIDLSHPAAGGLPPSAREIIVGLRLADMDGTPGQAWPWSNGAYGTMVKWSAGLSSSAFSVNSVHLDPSPQASVPDWSLY